jgi:hypothetical protein
MMFPVGHIHVPGLVKRAKRGAREPRASWHGRECEILGRWKKRGEYNYAAIRFPERGRYEYEIIGNRYVK